VTNFKKLYKFSLPRTKAVYLLTDFLAELL